VSKTQKPTAMLGIVEELTKSGTLKWKNIFANSFKSKLGPFDVKIDWPRDGKPSLCVMSEFICLFHLENWKYYLVGYSELWTNLL